MQGNMSPQGPEQNMPETHEEKDKQDRINRMPNAAQNGVAENVTKTPREMLQDAAQSGNTRDNGDHQTSRE